MKPGDKKKALILAVLVGLIAVTWGYRALTVKKPEAPTGKAVAASRGGAAPLQLTPVKVDLELLDRPVEPLKAGRNIFKPVYSKPELGKQGGRNVTVGDTPPLPPPPPPPPPPKPPEQIAAENAREDMGKFKPVGFLKRKGRTDVFLSYAGEQFIAGKGDTITKTYIMSDIGKDYIIISDSKTRVEVRLKMSSDEGESSKTMPSPGMGGGGGRPGQPVPAAGGAAPGSPKHRSGMIPPSPNDVRGGPSVVVVGGGAGKQPQRPGSGPVPMQNLSVQ